MRRLFATRVDTRMDGLVSLYILNKHYFDPHVFRCVPDPTSEYHLIFLTTASAESYDAFAYLIKRTYYSIFIDKLEFDYFNLNKIEE